MLRSLYIQNYTLIEKLDIDFSAGFSVITGETGAGKSIMLGAISLLLGQRADVKVIRQGAPKCTIEAHFDIEDYNLQSFFEENELEYETECILRRELHSSGKSRAFINDTPVTLQQMKELGDYLIDIHSQHQNLLLNTEGFQLDMLDVLAHNSERLKAYQELYKGWKLLQQELEGLIAQADRNKSDEDYIRFQLQQLEEARLNEHEQEELEQESDMLNHAEEIKAGLYRIDALLSADEQGILTSLKEALGILSGLQKVYTPAAGLSERVQSIYIDLKDIAREVSSGEEDVTFDPHRLEKVNERLNLLYSLQQKFRVDTVSELIQLTREYAEQLSSMTSCEERIKELELESERRYGRVKEHAALLTKSRTGSARKIEKEIISRLIPLGMPHVRFRVETGMRKEPGLHGEDTVKFLFSANKNSEMQPVASIASGGEIARVMLSIKAMMAGAVKLPTIIFDEIDTGVSGEIADRMADIMEEMGKQGRQVISITHLPQIAARGANHYKVYKRDNDTGTNSHIKHLDEQERIVEIAHMLSGANVTEAALNNARELLGIKQNI